MEKIISADALLKDMDELKKSPWYNTDNPFIQQGMRECMSMIKTLCIKKAPAVKVKKIIHGHWNNVTNPESVDSEYSCSVCTYTNFEDVINEFNFCPCCGTEMNEYAYEMAYDMREWGE